MNFHATWPKWFLIKQVGSSIKLSKRRKVRASLLLLLCSALPCPCSSSFVAVGYGTGRPPSDARLHSSLCYVMLLARMQLHSSPSNPAHGKSHASHVLLPKPSHTHTPTYLTHQQIPYYELHFHLLCPPHHFPPSNFGHRHQPQPAKHMT